jgi:hypothetical protein
MTEIVSHQNSFAPQMVEYVQSNEALADPILRRDYFEHMTEDDFIDMTQRIASLVRTGDSNQLQHFDGTTLALTTHEVPDQREKESLLRETWRTAQTLLHDRRLSDEDALEYAALTVAGGILYVHPFADGNGRTSRTLSYIIARGAESEDELRTMTENSSGGDAWHVAPNARLAFQRQFGGNQPDQIEFEDTFAGEATDPFGDTISNSSYNKSILRSLIEKADPDTQAIVERCTMRDEDGRSKLDGDMLLKELAASDRAAEYAQTLFGSYREVRADFIHRYLQAMVSETPIERLIKVPAGERGERMTGEIGKRAIDGLLLPRDQAAAEHRAYSDAHHR